MPELPEVEIMRQYFELAAFKKKIEDVELYDAKMLKGDIDDFKKDNIGKRFIKTDRRGKYLFAHTKDTTNVIHFGMTGDLELSSKSNDRPRFSRLAFVFKGGERLHLLSLRKFGYIKPIKDFNAFVEEKKLGEDALGMNKATFLRLMDGKKTKLKPFLMDQKHLAGIGNWIADELLHRCQLHPEQSLNTLGETEMAELNKELQKILKAAIRYKTNKGNFPKSWFVNQRSLSGSCTRCAGPISKLQVGGRSSYICSNCQ